MDKKPAGSNTRSAAKDQANISKSLAEFSSTTAKLISVVDKLSTKIGKSNSVSAAQGGSEEDNSYLERRVELSKILLGIEKEKLSIQNQFKKGKASEIDFDNELLKIDKEKVRLAREKKKAQADGNTEYEKELDLKNKSLDAAKESLTQSFGAIKNAKDLNDVHEKAAKIVEKSNSKLLNAQELLTKQVGMTAKQSANFQDLMKQLNRKENVQTDDAVLHIFDMIPMEDFMAGYCGISQEIRSKSLEIWFEEFQESLPNVKILSNRLVNLSTVTGREIFREMNEKAIEGGYEGLMIKDPTAPYECKRSSSWLKLKPYLDLSLEVVRIEEGSGKNLGSLGAIVCEGTESGKLICVNVGTGFSDEERAAIWSSKDSIIGQIAEVRADAITQNQDGSYSLRFPRFLHWRGFDCGEKI
jgi:hypothetical protein